MRSDVFQLNSTLFPPSIRVMRIRLTLLACMLACLAPAVHADFSFVHLTDTHFTTTEGAEEPAAKNNALFDEISGLSPKPSFAIHTGDVCESGTPEEYNTFRLSKSHLSLPLYIAPGNHDVRWNPQGKQGFEKGAGQPLYQSWDYQNVHFVLLDSTVLLQHWGHFNKVELDWLERDLKKAGRTKPVIIGFHHFFYRPGEVQIDNADALWKVIAPYNIRLFLIGHGHSDIEWSINGIPAIMAKGLYQGSYHLINVTKDRLTVYRRSAENPTPTTEVISVPLAPVVQPKREAAAAVTGNVGTVRLWRKDLPADAVCTFRLNASEEIPMEATPYGFEGKFQFLSATPGSHTIVITATLPDKRAYQTIVPLVLEGNETAKRSGSSDAMKPLWKVNVGGEVQGKPTLYDDTIYVPTMSGELVALIAKTGKERWRYRTGGPIFSAPLITQATVYFGSSDGSVYALDTESGKLRWRTTTNGPVFSGPARAGAVLCIASTDGKIYGLDLQNGHSLWSLPVQGMYQSQVATDGTHFFLGGWDNTFRCIEAKSGQELWSQKFGKNARGEFQFYYSPAIGSPTVGTDKVFVTSNDGLLHAMDIATGNVKWEVQGPALGYNSPLFYEGRVYNGSLTPLGRVFCFDERDGAKVWDQPTGSVIYDSSCTIGDGKVFIGCVEGTVSALRTDNGNVVWQYRLPPGHILSSPVTDGERVYIGSLNGEVTCFPVTPPTTPASAQNSPRLPVKQRARIARI